MIRTLTGLSFFAVVLPFVGCDESPGTSPITVDRGQPAEGQFTHKQWLPGYAKPKSTLKE